MDDDRHEDVVALPTLAEWKARRKPGDRRTIDVPPRIRNAAEWRDTRAEAEAVLAQVLEDEPELADVLYVAELELEASEN